MHLEQVVVHGLRAASEVPFRVDLPGRFAVVAGANAGGKSTLVDAIVLAHHDVFPFTPRPSSAVLSRSVAVRTIEVTYALPPTEDSPLGDMLASQGLPPSWVTTLTSSMGRVSASSTQELRNGQLPVMYMSPTRNPSLDLAGREAQLIVELLKSQGLRDRGDKSLRELRGALRGLVGSVTQKWPVRDAEERVGAHLAALTDGVAGRVPYLGTTTIDDTFLARVFEFLIATAGADRGDSRRLETEGLGYTNLLELAVILAAIPDLTRIGVPQQSGGPPESDEAAGQRLPGDTPAIGQTPGVAPSGSSEGESPADERQDLMGPAEENAALEGETFFAGNFHAIVLLEEPEAHLHPQLQHGLVAYLKQVVRERPEVQVVITTHSDEIVAACEPDDLVVCVGTEEGPAARTIKRFGLTASHRALARRHLDASRSASVFAERVVLVEGVTDAVVLRAFARVWAGEHQVKRRFVDALTITVVGSRVGPWLYRLLVDRSHPIAARLAILSDSDAKPPPKWVAPAVNMAGGRLGVFFSDPTLEPSLVAGNELLFRSIFGHKPPKSRPWEHDEGPTASNVAEFFKNGGRSRKASFADGVDEFLRSRPEDASLPLQISQLLEFVWAGFDGIGELPEVAEE